MHSQATHSLRVGSLLYAPCMAEEGRTKATVATLLKWVAIAFLLMLVVLVAFLLDVFIIIAVPN